MRLTLVFLILSLLAAFSIEHFTRPPQTVGKTSWSDQVFVRGEGRNCPLYFPAEDIR